MEMISTLFAIYAAPVLSGHAYLDPGSGSFILQLLLAGLLGGLFIVKSYWQKIVAFFRSRSNKGNDTGE
jgi:hypothetical protein